MTAPLTAEEIAELRRLVQDVTRESLAPGDNALPFSQHYDTAAWSKTGVLTGKAVFALPRLLDEVTDRRARYGDHLDVMEIAHKDGTAAREWIGRARELLKRIEWSANLGQNSYGCAVCQSEERQGHRPGCELAALIGGPSGVRQG